MRDGKGRPVQGIHPRRQAVAVRSEAGPVELVVEAASNPILVQFRPTPLGSPATAGDAELYRIERAELVRVDTDAEALLHDLTVLDAVMRTLPLDDPRRSRIRVAMVRALDVLAHPPGGCDDAGRRGARGRRAGARRARPVRCPSRPRHRPRPHRHGLAVAAARDRAQVHPYVRVGGRPHGRGAGLPVLLLAGPAVRLDRRARAGALRPHHRQGRRRPVDPRRRHVGRAGHEPAVRREHRAPDRVRAALLRGALRHALHGGVDPGRVRLPGRAAAGVRRRRDGPLRDAEAVVEPPEPLPALDVLVGGHRRHAGAHALPARRHVQRRGRAGRARLLGAAVRRAHVERVVAAAVRLRRRRRRPDAGDARAAPPARRPRRHAAARAGLAGPVLRPGRRGDRARRTGAGVARRALLRDPPRHAHEPAAHEARQQALRAAAAGGGAVDGHGRRRPRGARRAVARGAHAAVPRHHPGLVDRLGARRRRGGPRPHRRRPRAADRRPARGARAGGPGARQRGDRRARRGRRRRRRDRRPGAAPRRRAGGVPRPRPRSRRGAGRRPGGHRARRRDRPHDVERPARRQLGPRRQPALDHRRRPRPRAAARR